MYLTAILATICVFGGAVTDHEGGFWIGLVLAVICIAEAIKESKPG